MKLGKIQTINIRREVYHINMSIRSKVEDKANRRVTQPIIRLVNNMAMTRTNINSFLRWN